MRYRIMLAGVGVLSGARLAAADIATFSPSHDNTLYQSATGGASNGAGPTMFAGNNASSQIRRALVQFDLSSIPAGSIVQSVSLQLTCSQAASTAPIDITVHRLLASWGEGTSNAGAAGGGGAPSTTGDATWIHRFFNTTFWATQGGDFTAAPSASLTVGDPGAYTWGSTPSLVADVQGWVDDPGANFGWLVRGGEGGAQTARRFETRESTLPGAIPMLTITYTPVPAPTGAALLALAGLAGARRRR